MPYGRYPRRRRGRRSRRKSRFTPRRRRTRLRTQRRRRALVRGFRDRRKTPGSRGNTRMLSSFTGCRVQKTSVSKIVTKLNNQSIVKLGFATTPSAIYNLTFDDGTIGIDGWGDGKRAGLTTHVYRTRCKLRIFIPTAVLGSKVIVNWMICSPNKNVPIASVPLSVADSVASSNLFNRDQYFIGGDDDTYDPFRTQRNNLFKFHWKIVKRGRAVLGNNKTLAGSPKGPVNKAFRFTLGPHMYRWNNMSTSAAADMISGRLVFCIWYENASGYTTAATGTSEPDFDLHYTTEFNPRC